MSDYRPASVAIFYQVYCTGILDTIFCKEHISIYAVSEAFVDWFF